MVLMSETVTVSFWRLNQGFHITLVNKCQVSNVKPQNILLRKVADNLIFHTNKLGHEGDKSVGLLQILHSLCTFGLYMKTSVSWECTKCQQDTKRACLWLFGKTAYRSPNRAGRVIGQGRGEWLRELLL